MRKRNILYVLGIIGIFFYGWFAAPDVGCIWRECGPNDTHLFGLKFMPACTPFGSDALCGADGLFIICLFIGFVVINLYDPDKEKKHERLDP